MRHVRNFLFTAQKHSKVPWLKRFGMHPSSFRHPEFGKHVASGFFLDTICDLLPLANSPWLLCNAWGGISWRNHGKCIAFIWHIISYHIMVKWQHMIHSQVDSACFCSGLHHFFCIWDELSAEDLDCLKAKCFDTMSLNLPDSHVSFHILLGSWHFDWGLFSVAHSWLLHSCRLPITGLKGLSTAKRLVFTQFHAVWELFADVTDLEDVFR